MELYHEIRERAFVLILAGSLDGYNAGEIDRMLKKAIKSQKENLLVDCRNLKEVSSSGIGIFLAHLPHLKDNNINMQFFGMNPGVLKAFNFLNLHAVFNFTDQLPEALLNTAHS